MSSSSSRAVSMMIGTVLSARSRLQTSSPSSFGSIRSSTTRSTSSSAKRASASSPSRGVDDPEAVALERVGQQLLDRVLVVDEEDGRGVGHGRNARDGRGVPYTGRCNGAAQTSARAARAPTPRLGRAARERAARARNMASRRVAAAAGRLQRRAAATAAAADAAADVRRRDRRAARPRARPRVPGPLARLAGRPRRRRLGLRPVRALRLRAAGGALHGADPGPRRGRAAEPRHRRARRLAARDRDHRAPRQHRRGRRRERQRLRHGAR